MKFRESQITEMDELVSFAESHAESVRILVDCARRAKTFDEWDQSMKVAWLVLRGKPAS